MKVVAFNLSTFNLTFLPLLGRGVAGVQYLLTELQTVPSGKVVVVFKNQILLRANPRIFGSSVARFQGEENEPVVIEEGITDQLSP